MSDTARFVEWAPASAGATILRRVTLCRAPTLVMPMKMGIQYRGARCQIPHGLWNGPPPPRGDAISRPTLVMPMKMGIQYRGARCQIPRCLLNGPPPSLRMTFLRGGDDISLEMRG